MQLDVRTFLNQIFEPDPRGWEAFSIELLRDFNLPEKALILYHERENTLAGLIPRSEPGDAERFPVGNFACGLDELEWLTKQQGQILPSDHVFVASMESVSSATEILSFCPVIEVKRRIDNAIADRPNFRCNRETSREFIWLDRDLYPRQFGGSRSRFPKRTSPPPGLLPL